MSFGQNWAAVDPTPYQQVNDPVELVDIFPTMCELAGIPIPPQCPSESASVQLCSEGQSFAPLISNRERGTTKLKTWKAAAFTQYPRPSNFPINSSDKPKLKDITIMGYSVRTRLHHYIEWVGFDKDTFTSNWMDVHAKELYLLDRDPEENHNQAYNKYYRNISSRLSKQLKQGWR